MSQYDYWDEDYEPDDDDFCPKCQGRGYIPALDYESITGIEGWACDACERGNNSNYPFRPVRDAGAGQ